MFPWRQQLCFCASFTDQNKTKADVSAQHGHFKGEHTACSVVVAKPVILTERVSFLSDGMWLFCDLVHRSHIAPLITRGRFNAHITTLPLCYSKHAFYRVGRSPFFNLSSNHRDLRFSCQKQATHIIKWRNVCNLICVLQTGQKKDRKKVSFTSSLSLAGAQTHPSDWLTTDLILLPQMADGE